MRFTRSCAILLWLGASVFANATSAPEAVKDVTTEGSMIAQFLPLLEKLPLSDDTKNVLQHLLSNYEEQIQTIIKQDGESKSLKQLLSDLEDNGGDNELQFPMDDDEGNPDAWI